MGPEIQNVFTNISLLTILSIKGFQYLLTIALFWNLNHCFTLQYGNKFHYQLDFSMKQSPMDTIPPKKINNISIEIKHNKRVSLNYEVTSGTFKKGDS